MKANEFRPMKANEFRLNNLVLKNDILHEIAFYDFSSFFALDEYKSIPLTEEWLLNFNFQDKYSEKRIYFKIKGMLIEVKPNGKFYYNNIHLKYLHQMQNLYFALTNEELTIEQ